MITITVAASKGGVGKTTIAACLAVRAAQEHRAAIIDMDPQQSIAYWHQRRGKTKRNPRIVGDVTQHDVESVLAELASEGHRYAIIDTPPAMIATIEAAIHEADVVVIPVKASALDITAINVTVEICQLFNVAFGFVLNDAEPQWKITRSAEETLAEIGPLFGTISHRAAYVSAMTVGRTGPESQSDRAASARAGEEVDALWNAVLASIPDAEEA